jgi:hypothetical protein
MGRRVAKGARSGACTAWWRTFCRAGAGPFGSPPLPRAPAAAVRHVEGVQHFAGNVDVHVYQALAHATHVKRGLCRAGLFLGGEGGVDPLPAVSRALLTGAWQKRGTGDHAKSAPLRPAR